MDTDQSYCNIISKDVRRYFFFSHKQFYFLYLSYYTIFEFETLQFTETFEI
jgi:hypothetical protein